ncbi:MAG: hypothetical protein ACNS60_20125 [Candidatus Cyclobacteriaceae bacterium M2_1C_046]
MWLRLIIIIALFGIVFFILPNLFNLREKEHFSEEKRVAKAKKLYRPKNLQDTIIIKASEFYSNRSGIHYWAFGKKYRDVWETEVKVPVFTENDSTQTYSCYDVGGGQQTIAIEIKDKKGRVWTLRSVDKDQSGALSPFWKSSFIRSMIRDAAAGMNPYAAFVVDDLSEAANIPHTNPRLIFIPYLESFREECRNRMAGRLVLLEEELDEQGWSGSDKYFNADTIVDSEDMFDALRLNPDRSIDSLKFLKARLFDILIADWDRHEGNWAWALKNGKYIPIPIDRDMAFYLFDDGAINQFFLLFNNKFRSFHPEFKDVTGFSANSRDIDQKILKGIPENIYVAYADSLQRYLTDSAIAQSFKEYPEAVYQKTGPLHTEILISRRDQLKEVARLFYEAVNE